MNEITTYHGVTLSAWDERGEEVSKEAVEMQADSNWRRFNGRLTFPTTARTLKVAVGRHGAIGISDFDDTEVKFR